MVDETPVSGTEGYAHEAEALFRQYESISFADLNRAFLHLLPPPPARVLDIGAGTGRDAAALAAMGHDVVAVEPTAELRHGAAALHASPRIEWLDDSLPELAVLDRRGDRFDLVVLSAVWMHLDEGQRRRAMPAVARCVRPGGTLLLSLRHGPVPAGRRMFAVSADETIALAAREGLEPAIRLDDQPGLFGRPGVRWTRLAFTLVG
ncbi:methyltransferase family protein [Stella humosa]|uniref:Methyltransferase family protein n=2 Tax=Stella humosa TaxID=94 RepID=A0A3N1M9H7_9PROT|nr:methyltransferase family protein [Stella humosa]BBK30464.1 hypothetical protein STHU_10980 [Stella humosa]